MLGFAIGNATDIFACMSWGSSPASRIAWNAASSPTSVISTLRIPWAADRRMSSSACTRPSWPWLAPPTAAPPSVRAAAEGPHAAVGLREQAHLDPSVRGEPRHLVELVVGQEEAPAPLRDPLDRHLAPLRLVEDRLEGPRALRARDLDAERRAVGEPLRGVRRAP